MKRDGNRIVLTFDATDALKPTDGNRCGYLHGFTIAGADRKFVWAKAYVRDEKRLWFRRRGIGTGSRPLRLGEQSL